MDLVSAAPVGDSVEVGGEWGVSKKLGLFVLCIFRQGEREVGDDAAGDYEEGVPEVLAEVGVAGGGRRRVGYGAEGWNT